jgi:hypothetical protein
LISGNGAFAGVTKQAGLAVGSMTGVFRVFRIDIREIDFKHADAGQNPLQVFSQSGKPCFMFPQFFGNGPHVRNVSADCL